MSDPAFGPSPTLPARFGRYHIVAVIPGGNMGRLYLAEDPDIDRRVVVKALDGDRNPDEKKRFLREARAAGRLSHRNVVPVFDVGEQDQTPFIVMEHIVGDTLANLIRSRGPMRFSRRLELVEQLCDGLAYAHDQGVVHRDIKPSNLMIDKAGTLRILDFGIARLDVTEQTQTSSAIIGTLNYMSPEQWEGGTINQRSDIFSVGAVVYELMSYTRAFPGNTPPEVLRAVFGSGPTPLHEAAPGVLVEVSELVHRMMERLPEDRFESLHVVRAEVLKLLGPARAIEEQLVGETVQLDSSATAATMAAARGSGSESISKTAALVRDLATVKAGATARRPPAPRTSQSAQIETSVVTEEPDVSPPVVRPRRSWVVLGIASVLLIGAASFGGWFFWGRTGDPPTKLGATATGGTAPTGAGAVTAIPPNVPTGTETKTGAGRGQPAANGGTGPVAAPGGTTRGKTNTTSSSGTGASRGGRADATADAGAGRASSPQPAQPGPIRVTITWDSPFDLLQGSTRLSTGSATEHTVEVRPDGGAVVARSPRFLATAEIPIDFQHPRSEYRVPPPGSLAVVMPNFLEPCMVVIDDREFQRGKINPDRPQPIGVGRHSVSLKCDDGRREPAQTIVVTSGQTSRVDFPSERHD